VSRITPEQAGGRNVCAFLDMLGYSEGTVNSPTTKDDGYDQIVGQTRFDSYVDHPNVRVWIPRINNSSTAAGRYQLLHRYWVTYKRELSLADFSPINQDLVAIRMFHEQRAYNLIQTGWIESAIERCRNIWASLPGAGYGQHENRASDLLAVYAQKGGLLK
jgi:muramidase (phage lysozyme)